MAEINGIQLVESEGQSKYKSVNCKHKDLSFLNHSSLALIGEHIISQMNDETKYKRVTKKELIRLVAKWMKADNEFGLGELKEKWHEPIHKISN